MKSKLSRMLRVGTIMGVVAGSMLGAVAWAPSVHAADPPHTLAFGAYAQPVGGQSAQQAVTALETQIGRKLEVVRVFQQWSDQFPDSYDRFLDTGGRTIMLSIKPLRSNGTKVTWTSIANAAPGSQVDTEIRSWARRIRDFGSPIYVTLHHEPESSSSYGTATDFIAAWRHWVDVFREEGVTNARFMWIMTDYSFQVAQSDRRYAPKWYPGDEWVDTMAIDAYNWHVCRPNQDNVWKSLAQIIDDFRTFGLLHPTKKLWLTEWATWEDPAITDHKAHWIDDARALFAQPAYQQFGGIAYFHSDAINPNFTDCVWRVSTSASSLASFAAMANDPLFSGDAFGEPVPPDPVPPVAGFTSACADLACTFTDTSTDSDGNITEHAWQFGDTNSATNTADTISATHTFSAPGTYTVSLSVNDDDTLTNTITHDLTVTVAPPPDPVPQPPVFRAASSANTSGTTASVLVPSAVVAGDRLIFIVTANMATTATTPAGWTLLDLQSDGSPDIRSWVFTRAAIVGTAGSTVTSTLGATGKSSRILLAYGAAGAPTVASLVAGPSTAAHETPAASVVAGSTVVSYWSDKTNDNAGWILPAEVLSRSSSAGTSSGRITASAGDTTTVGTAWPGATATATSASGKAIMWSIVVPSAGPPPANQPPTAAFTSSCTGLTCTLSAASSTDTDGDVTNASWSFGDNTSGTDLSTSHTFGAAGTYPVTVTVTDNGGASASTSHDVIVSVPIGSPITFVGQASANANTTSHGVVVPANVQPGDGLILAFTSNTTATVGSPAGITGWRLLGVQSNGSMSTRIWTRVASAGNGGTAITLTTSVTSKGNLVLSAYRGTSGIDPVASFASSLETTSRTTHTTPDVTVTSDGAWVVWYWAHEDSSTTALAPPTGVAVRSNSTQTGSARVTGMLADTNGPATLGTAAGLTATAAAANVNATMWSIVLAPA